MINLEEYKSFIQIHTQELINFVQLLSVEQLKHTTPSGWTILQELEHINIVDKAVYLGFNIKAERHHDELYRFGKEKAEKILLGMRNRKVVAPANMEPSGKYTSVDEFVKEIEYLRKRLITNLEQGKIVIDNRVVVHPYLGDLTSADWLYFIVYHGQRHLLNMQDRFKAE
jgi:hypothetical protein